MIKHVLVAILLSMGIHAHAQSVNAPYILVLGVAQDGGYPHMGCTKKCCAPAWRNPALKKYVVSLAVVDPATKKWWLIEATPDIKEQLQYFRELTDSSYDYLPDGIFITHAHIGHYTGLMELGREVMNTSKIPVYVLPKMKAYLQNNGPWSQLVKLENISLNEIGTDNASNLSEAVQITAFTVPHRDEYSETAGFRITVKGKKYMFIPDINKWDKWSTNITDAVRQCDVAMIDGTFYDENELPGRKMSEVPHPFIKESISLFANTGKATTSKVYFIHLNHTNPLLWDKDAQKTVQQAGFNIAVQGQKL